MTYFVKNHERKVQIIQEQLLTSKKKVALKRNLSHTLRNGSYKKEAFCLDLSSFDEILDLNIEKKSVTVEPRVLIKELSTFLYKKNLLLPVVPEFANITIAGAVMGAAIESSSFRYGQLSDQLLEVELLLATGERIFVSPEKKRELFYGIIGSYGTLAIALSFTFKLIEAKPYITLTFTKCPPTKIIESLLTIENKDFLEAIVYSKEKAIKISGALAERDPKLPLYRNNRFSPWYIEQSAKQEGPLQMPLLDYLFRLDRGAFWMGFYILSFPLILGTLFRKDLLSLPKKIRDLAKTLSFEKGASFFTRLFFDSLFTSKSLYKLWHKVPKSISEELFFIQDFYLPVSKSQTMLNIYMNSLELFPIWLCPVKNSLTPQILSPNYHEEFLIDIGLYGIPKNPTPISLLTKNLEEELLRIGGKKMLYSYTYLDEKSFTTCYNDQKLRKEFRAEHTFLSLYEKITQ